MNPKLKYGLIGCGSLILLAGMAMLAPVLGIGIWGQRFLNIAVGAMISVPYLRVVAVTFHYGAHKRRTFFLISLLVLVILTISVLQGIG